VNVYSVPLGRVKQLVSTHDGSSPAPSTTPGYI
jgi:hypothetical protein